MEPKTQVEIQLGHMCNNRCVFCVSGQETALGRARPLPVEPILEQVRAAYAAGNRKITLLGGEPTLQPGFMQVVRTAVELGFEEIVIFTNGVKTAREAFLDEVIATGGAFTWRFSVQGATKEAHERTTLKDGSFDRIVRSMRHLAKRGQRITVNMCVVRSNFESVEHFAELLGPVGAVQLHLDMVRPLDAGQRTEAEFADMIPRYSDMVGPLQRMVAGFAEGFDINIGNLPYCVAPHLARYVHHDGEHTLTITVDGDKTLSRPFDKYLVKRRDKMKPESCRNCVFDGRCNGIFEKYRDLYGLSEFVPITPERLLLADPERQLFSLHARAHVAGRLSGWAPPAPFQKVTAVESGEREVLVTLEGDAPLVVAIRPPEEMGVAATKAFSLRVVRAPGRTVTLSALRALWEALAAPDDIVHPLGDDAVFPIARSVGARLRLLRQRAPFGSLRWVDVQVMEEGHRAELAWIGPEGERFTVWLADSRGRPAGGYRLGETSASPSVIEGLRAVMEALGAARQSHASRPPVAQQRP
jgi:MoaA/NifB/PqqE/SkfB family radical SAM enzyme